MADLMGDVMPRSQTADWQGPLPQLLKTHVRRRTLLHQQSAAVEVQPRPLPTAGVRGLKLSAANVYTMIMVWELVCGRISIKRSVGCVHATFGFWFGGG